MKEKNAWYTLFAHAFNFRKIGYFSNPPRNVDANFNNFSCTRVRPTNTVSMARRICECSNSPDAHQVSFKHC